MRKHSHKMGQIGLPERRYTLVILNGLYLAFPIPLIFLMIFKKMYSIPFTVCCLCALLGLSGFCILCREDHKLMNIYRKALIGVILLQIIAFFSTLVILILRPYIAEMFLKHLIKDYHIDPSVKDTMDTVQINFECCGINSYKDWSSSLPPSCCGKSVPFCNASLTKFLGCKENLSMFMLLICLAFLFVSTGNIVLHAYCIRCALKLSEEYRRAMNRY